MTMRRIAIVGGGIAGLTLAAALDPRRFDVTLHEAQPGRATFGGGLGLWPSARRALAELGVLQELRGDIATLAQGSLHDIHGHPLARARDVGLAMVPRPALLRALAAAVPDSVGQVTEEVLDPSDLDADVVVGCDGVRSRVRALVQPNAAERLETPWIALRGSSSEAPDAGAIGEYWGPGQLFGLVPLSTNATYWFTTHRSELGPEPLDPGQVVAEVREVFADAAPNIRRTLDLAGPGTLATRIWVAPPMRRYVHGRYAVLGDAAHAMTPNLGRGACDAIVDAVTFARALERDRLPQWQVRRLPLTQAARAASGLVMRIALADAPLRDRALRTLSRVGP